MTLSSSYADACAVLVIATVVITTIASFRTVSGTSEKRLISTLLENYKQNGVEGRPVLDTSRPLSVSISFSLIQILKVDRNSQVITLVGWIHLQWRDALLRWNASEYDNIYQVVLHPRQIWTPDVILVNAVGPPQLIHDTKLLALHVGQVLWVSQIVYSFSCPSLNHRADEPSCELRFGSWTLNTDLFRLVSLTPRLDTTHYVRHTDWDLVRTRVRTYELQYLWSGTSKYSYVMYRFTLKKIHSLVAPIAAIPPRVKFTQELNSFQRSAATRQSSNYAGKRTMFVFITSALCILFVSA